MKTVDIKDLVKVVVLYCNLNGLSISPLKLQKILYYIQAWHIAKFDKAPLFDELPEAWVNGPVYRSVYDLLKPKFFRNDSIERKIEKSVGQDFDDALGDLDLTEEQKSVLNSVLKFYCPKDNGTLVLKTHSDDPWNEAREGLGPFERSTNHISVDSMYNFYSAKLV